MLAYPDTNPAMLDDEKLAARDRLYRRLVAAHCDNDSVSVEQVEEWLIVTLDDQRWRVFFGFKGYVELVHDDSPAQSFDVNDPGDDDLGWYHHQLMTNAVGYAQGLLDESGLQRQRAEEERLDATLAAITRRQAGDRQMTGSMNDFARLSEMNVGDAVKLDAGFDCGIAGKTLVVNEDDRGLFVACDEGRHYLDGQLADDGDHLVGVYPVEGETVEVWSSDSALNGTTMIVDTVAKPDSFELAVADLLPDDDDGDEEPGAMCKRALAKAEASVDLIRRVRLLVVGAENEADFEATYGTDPDEVAVYTNAAKKIVALVRAADGGAS